MEFFTFLQQVNVQITNIQLVAMGQCRFLRNIMFSDEAHFYFNAGVVKKQNCGIWAIELP